MTEVFICCFKFILPPYRRDGIRINVFLCQLVSVDLVQMVVDIRVGCLFRPLPYFLESKTSVFESRLGFVPLLPVRIKLRIVFLSKSVHFFCQRIIKYIHSLRIFKPCLFFKCRLDTIECFVPLFLVQLRRNGELLATHIPRRTGSCSRHKMHGLKRRFCMLKVCWIMRKCLL